MMDNLKKRRLNKPKVDKQIQVITATSTVTFIMITLFLKGFFMPIENGTPQGIITAIIGVGVIVLFNFLVLVGILTLIKRNKTNKL